MTLLFFLKPHYGYQTIGAGVDGGRPKSKRKRKKAEKKHVAKHPDIKIEFEALALHRLALRRDQESRIIVGKRKKRTGEMVLLIKMMEIL